MMAKEILGATLFESVPLSEGGQATRSSIESSATDILKVLNELPESRYKNLAVTHLETAVLWANKAISRNQ